MGQPVVIPRLWIGSHDCLRWGIKLLGELCKSLPFFISGIVW